MDKLDVEDVVAVTGSGAGDGMTSSVVEESGVEAGMNVGVGCGDGLENGVTNTSGCNSRGGSEDRCGYHSIRTKVDGIEVVAGLHFRNLNEART